MKKPEEAECRKQCNKELLACVNYQLSNQSCFHYSKVMVIADRGVVVIYMSGLNWKFFRQVCVAFS